MHLFFLVVILWLACRTHLNEGPYALVEHKIQTNWGLNYPNTAPSWHDEGVKTPQGTFNRKFSNFKPQMKHKIKFGNSVKLTVVFITLDEETNTTSQR